MARILLVGCGCRGQRLAASLAGEGHAVRGTTRSPDRLAAIAAVGAEAVLADPDRLGPLLPALEGVRVVCWLLGSARGEPEAVAALHGPRLGSLLEKVVDTPGRGMVYEAAGTLPAEVLEGGVTIARRAALTYRMSVRVVDRRPEEQSDWLTAARGAVDAVLTG